MNSNYEAVIGIEVHVQLQTQSKIFSADATNFDAGDNENISPVTLGMPGTLPVLNKNVIDLAIKTGLALGCHIRTTSVFARKNYFYPDLPKGYQISQFDQPICEDGQLEFEIDGQVKKVSIIRAHLEEDAGKSTHFPQYTLLNYNRAGIPLLEVVSGPDMHSAAEAAEYCRQLRSIVRFIGVCDGNLEEGSLRCDCNVSVKKVGESQLGTRVELKNLNSFRFIEKAIEFEIERQIDVIESGKKVIQETRLYDSDKNRTFTMRVKEDADDYRYFSDPDLLPVIISAEKLEAIKKSLPELPQARKQRYIKDWDLNPNDAATLSSEVELCQYFEKVCELTKKPKESASWILVEVLRVLNEQKTTFKNLKITSEKLAQIINRVSENKISVKNAKVVFSYVAETGEDVDAYIEKNNLAQVLDEGFVSSAIQKVVSTYKDQVQEYLSGKEKVLSFLIGAVMKETRGKAQPDQVNELLKKEIEKQKD